MSPSTKFIPVLFAVLFLPAVAQATDSVDTTVKLKEVVVTAKAFPRDAAPLPELEGAKIYAGKKTSVIDVDAAPATVNNNFRQTLQKTPGLLLSEESTPLFSVGYRGLDPHRAQFTQVLKDGIPIHADMFGYPEAYYVPTLETVDSIEFLHGGASLMYGPQPGGALNFVTHDPYEGPFRLLTENSIGSYDLFSTFTSLSGTQGSVGHYSYLHHRQSQGFRDFNSQFDVYYGGTKFVVQRDPSARWTIAVDLYEEEHGEPGGLTRANFDQNPSMTTLLSDRFELNRYAGHVSYEKEVDADTHLDWKLFGGYYERASWRQRGGGFGTAPSGAAAGTNSIENQRFYTAGSEARMSRRYDAFGSDEHVLTGGVFYYHVTSPRTDERGTTSDAQSGVLRNDADRDVNNLAVFFENLFKFGRFSVTPGVRLESIWQGVKENVNLDKTAAGSPLADDSSFDFVPLFGVGSAYEVTPDVELYGNVSQSYRPKIYSQAVPTGALQVINGDLEEGKSWQTDIGLRGKPVDYFSWDASLFYMEFEDQIGTVTNTVQNVGDAEHKGVELGVQFGVLEWADAMSGGDAAARYGSFNLFYNLTLLDAEFVGGPNAGFAPQYAPDYIMKSGVEYLWKDCLKLRLTNTFVDEHFGNDDNTAQRFVPSYKVWDLTGELKVWKDTVSVFGGVSNIFDEAYFSRVRADGIDPAAPRNYYGGVRVVW